jgi:hypothetical protein
VPSPASSLVTRSPADHVVSAWIEPRAEVELWSADRRDIAHSERSVLVYLIVRFSHPWGVIAGTA